MNCDWTFWENSYLTPDSKYFLSFFFFILKVYIRVLFFFNVLTFVIISIFDNGLKHVILL